MPRVRKLPWLERIRRSLDISAERLAHIMQVDVMDVYQACAENPKIDGDMDDEAFDRLLIWLNGHIGFALAAQREMQHHTTKLRRGRVVKQAMARK